MTTIQKDLTLFWTFSLAFLFFTQTSIQAQKTEPLTYQQPPQAIADLVNAPTTPRLLINPSRTYMAFLSRPSLPPIDEVGKEELRLGGIRIDPATNGSSRSYYYNGMSIQDMAIDKTPVPVEGLPENPKIENMQWSADGNSLAFTITQATGLELWIVDVKTKKASRCTPPILNDALRGSPYAWLSNSKTILFKAVLADRGAKPQPSSVPTGPVIQENAGENAPVRTYQDLLKSPFDEALFSYYTTSQIWVYDIKTKTKKAFGKPGIITDLSPSPDGQYVRVATLHQPFSYLVPYTRFPFYLDILDQKGNLVKRLADIPAAENIPTGFGAVRKGPRNWSWRSDAPATLFWVEAQDDGDPNKEAAVRDQLYFLTAPFSGTPGESVSTALRFGGIEWGSDKLAMVYEWWWPSRKVITSHFRPSIPGKDKKVVFDYSWEDAYNDPGNFQTTYNAYGRSVLKQSKDGKYLYLTGEGASPEGNRPFLDKMALSDYSTERLWRSEAPYYEYPVSMLNDDPVSLMVRRESTKTPPNYFIRDTKSGNLDQVTFFPNPYESLDQVQKELIKYTREDGVELTGTLYLPPNYDKEKDDPLPVFMWAYPREYKSADAASQVKDSPYEFIRLYWGSPIYWVMQGYAVFDDFGMPIIGEGDEEPNETFVKQLRMSAEAAIDHIVEMGVADRNRIAVGGHSYGAFMTANLLAHTDLFAAGIARSGAYNRTLTPFGFQAEERTFWEAPEVYFSMSPFMHAQKLKEPLLLIHGQADNNSGTFPMQSERFFAALKGHGATVRLVMLPKESHGYRSQESIMHMMWEMTEWLDKHVKNKETR